MLFLINERARCTSSGTLQHVEHIYYGLYVLSYIFLDCGYKLGCDDIEDYDEICTFLYHLLRSIFSNLITNQRIIR